MSYIGYVVRGRKSLSGSVVCNKELMVADDRSPETECRFHKHMASQ